MTTPSEILVVDDDVPSLAGLLSLLRNLGYRTTGAANVEGGYAMLDAFPFAGQRCERMTENVMKRLDLAG